MKNIRPLLFISALLLVMLACTSTVATPTPTPFPSPRPTQFVPYQTPTMSVGELAYQMAQKKMENELALQKLSIESTGTAFVIGVTATNVQQRMDVASTQKADQAIAETEAANKLSTATSAAATQVWTELTLSAVPSHATMTQVYIEGQIVVDRNNVEASKLDLEKKRDTNKISWQIPLLILICVTALFALYVWRTSRWNTIIDGNGQLHGFGFNDQFVQPALLSGPVLNLGRDTVVNRLLGIESNTSVPQVVDAETQKEIVLNNQRIKALEALSAVSPQSGYQSFNGYFNQAPRDEFDVVDGETLPAGLDDEGLASLDKDWNEAVNG